MRLKETEKTVEQDQVCRKWGKHQNMRTENLQKRKQGSRGLKKHSHGLWLTAWKLDSVIHHFSLVLLCSNVWRKQMNDLKRGVFHRFLPAVVTYIKFTFPELLLHSNLHHMWRTQGPRTKSGLLLYFIWTTRACKDDQKKTIRNFMRRWRKRHFTHHQTTTCCMSSYRILGYFSCRCEALPCEGRALGFWSI